MNEINWHRMELDEGVVPLVEYFNENGLTTNMSCQGHEMLSMSMFWIEFDKSVTEDDILDFMKNHLRKHSQFCSNGRFAKWLIGFHSVPDGTWKKEESWNYFAASVEAAHDDLEFWKNGTKWEGINGEMFQECVRIYKNKMKLDGKEKECYIPQ